MLALGVLTSSLRQTAVAILRTGNATRGVESATGVFVATGKIDAKHPLFIKIGLQPGDQAEFGVI